MLGPNSCNFTQENDTFSEGPRQLSEILFWSPCRCWWCGFWSGLGLEFCPRVWILMYRHTDLLPESGFSPFRNGSKQLARNAVPDIQKFPRGGGRIWGLDFAHRALDFGTPSQRFPSGLWISPFRNASKLAGDMASDITIFQKNIKN